MLSVTTCLLVTGASCVVCRYWVSIGLLLKWVQAHPDTLWWPWTEHHVLQGEMERSYLSYLLTSDPCITAVGGSHRISVIHVRVLILPHSCTHANLYPPLVCSLPMAVFRTPLVMSSDCSRPLSSSELVAILSLVMCSFWELPTTGSPYMHTTAASQWVSKVATQ